MRLHPIRRTPLPRSTKPLKRTPLKKKDWSGRPGRTPIKKRRAGPPRKGRVHDPEYLAWIRTLPCLICWLSSYALEGVAWVLDNWTPKANASEAAHFGIRGMSQKSDDREAGPLCPWHHRISKDSHHVLGKSFWEHHHLVREKIIKDLNANYESERADV